MTRDYWEICITEACEEAGIAATEEQINTLVGWVEGGHENYSLATGGEIAARNYVSEEAQELKSLKAEIEKRRVYEAETTPCRTCCTTGTRKDGYGRDVTCGVCRGEGRVKS